MTDISWNRVFLRVPFIFWNCSLVSNKTRAQFYDPGFLFILLSTFLVRRYPESMPGNFVIAFPFIPEVLKDLIV